MSKNRKPQEDMYDVDSYTDEELFNVLDLVNPSDRELEAKILMSIENYKEDPALSIFFEEIYNHFFESSEQEEETEEEETEEQEEQEDKYQEHHEETHKQNVFMKAPIVEGLSNRSSDEKSTHKRQLTKDDGEEEEEEDVAKTNDKTQNKPKNLPPGKVQKNKDKPLNHTTNFDYTGGKLNPLLKETQKRMIHIDSKLRENPSNDSVSTQNQTSTNFIFNLSDPLLDVVALRLHSVNIPYTWYNISNTYQANYFILYGISPGIEGKYSFTFTVPVGVYDINGLNTALTTATNQVVADNPDVNFGTTAITYNPQTLKLKITLDIKNIFTENNYSVVVSSTIAEALGWIDTMYPLDVITSNFSLAQSTSFQSTDTFQVIQNTLSTPGNNYFTIYNYDGTGSFNLSDPSSVYDIITVTLSNISGLQSRSTIVNALSSAVQTSTMLDQTSMVQLVTKTYTDVSGQHNVEQYEMTLDLNRKTTHNITNMKQIVVFPDESALSLTGRPIWTGATSCFLFDQSANLNTVQGELPIQTSNITINSTNNLFDFIPLPGSIIDTSINNISFVVPDGTYNTAALCYTLNTLFGQNPLTLGTVINIITDASNNQTVRLIANINKVYTTADYNLQFYNEVDTPLYQSNTNGASLKKVKWDVTLGWMMGFRSATEYDLAPTSNDNALYIYQNNYTYDNTTNIITLTSDTCINLFLFNNFYIILDDFTQNHLNDGLVTVTKQATDIKAPSYANKSTYRLSPDGQTVVSFNNSVRPNTALQYGQLYSASEIQKNSMQKNFNNKVIDKQKRFTDPPFLKDMFAMVPLKLSGLAPGATFSEFGGALQDNDRKYFGTVNIRRLHIQLVNDYGDILELNNANWSFSFVCEYLYTANRT